MKDKPNIDHLMLLICLKDDKEAFKTLFFSYFPSLSVFASRYVGKANSNDIVQDTFYNIWKNRKQLNIEISGRNFLITSVKNRCIDYIRKKELDKKYHDRILLSSESNTKYDQFDNLYELENLIESAIDQLPQHIKVTFELNRFYGLTYAEIAQKQGLSVKTIEAHISKALKFLRIQLKDYLPFTILFLY